MCDTAVVVGDGSVLFAKNSDRDANEAQVLEWHPRTVHAPGSVLPCTWVEVPQAALTNAVLLSRPFWMWGAEMGANEHGVVAGNEAVFTRQPYARTGLTGMDLLRLALERAATAYDAVSVMVTLLERHGQGGGCGHEHRDFTYHNGFLVADPSEAWVLETAGRLWAVERVSAGIRTISNGLSIPGFAERHRDRLRTAVAAATVRCATTARLAAREPSVAGLMRMLRSHGSHPFPRYSPVNGAMSAPCMHAGGLVARSQTTASWVSELYGDAAVHWATATAAPCTSLFKPFSVSVPVDLGPAPDDTADGRSLWWRHERLHRTAMRDPAVALPLLAAERDAVEAGWLAERPDPANAVAEGDALLESWTARVDAAVRDDVRPAWVRRYWHVRDRRAEPGRRPGRAAPAH